MEVSANSRNFRKSWKFPRTPEIFGNLGTFRELQKISEILEVSTRVRRTACGSAIRHDPSTPGPRASAVPCPSATQTAAMGVRVSCDALKESYAHLYTFCKGGICEAMRGARAGPVRSAGGRGCGGVAHLRPRARRARRCGGRALHRPVGGPLVYAARPAAAPFAMTQALQVLARALSHARVRHKLPPWECASAATP